MGFQPNQLAALRKMKTSFFDDFCSILAPGTTVNDMGGRIAGPSIVVTGISTTVAVGAESATQQVASTAGMVAGQSFYFGAAKTHAIVAVVVDGTHVTFTTSVNTTTGEAVNQDIICLTRPKRRQPIENAAEGAQTATKQFEVLLPVGTAVRVTSQITTGRAGIFQVLGTDVGKENAVTVCCDCIRVDDGDN